MAPIATTPFTAGLVAARCNARVPPRDWPATNTSRQSRRRAVSASWADRTQSVQRVSAMASGVSPWPASNGPMTSYPAAARYSPSPRISGGVPANPWISRHPRVPPRMRNGRSWSGWGGLLQIGFVRTAITSAVYRPASSATRSGLYGPAKLSPSASGRDDRNCGGEQADGDRRGARRTTPGHPARVVLGAKPAAGHDQRARRQLPGHSHLGRDARQRCHRPPYGDRDQPRRPGALVHGQPLHQEGADRAQKDDHAARRPHQRAGAGSPPATG